MTSILLWFLAAFLVLLIAATLLPLRIRLSASSSPRWRVQVHTTWLGGLTLAIRVIDSDRRRPARKAEKPPKPRASPRRWRAPRGLPTLISDLLGRFEITEVNAEGQFGFADPADTGVVFGMLAPLAYGGPHVSRISVNLRPVFERPCLSGKLDATVRVTPAALIPPVLRFAWRNFAARYS